MGVIKQVTSESEINGVFDNFYEQVKSVELEMLKYVGEAFVNKARSTRTYKDRTGNLRGSIGYVIAHDGKVLESNLNGTAEGVKKANEVVKQVLSNDRETGFVLIGVAGMEYAYFVESKGYDVITGSAKEVEKMLKSLMQSYENNV